MLGVPPGLKGFGPGDDASDANIYELSALAVGSSATDLLWKGQGTVGPITPVGYVAKIVNLMIASKATTAIEVTIIAQGPLGKGGTTSSITIGVFAVGAVGGNTPNGQQFSTENFRLLAQAGCKFQAAASYSAAVTVDVVAHAKYVKGGSL